MVRPAFTQGARILQPAALEASRGYPPPPCRVPTVADAGSPAREHCRTRRSAAMRCKISQCPTNFGRSGSPRRTLAQHMAPRLRPDLPNWRASTLYAKSDHQLWRARHASTAGAITQCSHTRTLVAMRLHIRRAMLASFQGQTDRFDRFGRLTLPTLLAPVLQRKTCMKPFRAATERASSAALLVTIRA